MWKWLEIMIGTAKVKVEYQDQTTEGLPSEQQLKGTPEVQVNCMLNCYWPYLVEEASVYLKLKLCPISFYK